MGITSKELAQKLGVSAAAVSIALNGRKGISDGKREMILAAAKEFGLQFNARKTQGSSVINYVIFRKHGLVFGDTPFFSSVMEGITSQVAENGYRLQVSYLYESNHLQNQLNTIAASGSAGILLLATEMSQEDMLLVNQIDCPVVVLDSYSESCSVDSLVINNIQGAYLATRHLMDHGHRKLGHLQSSVIINNFQERRLGYEMAIESAAGRSGCTSVSIQVGSTHESAYSDMCAYLDQHNDLPTAFFADNDIIAVSCLRALKEHGYRIPDDVSLVGFDDEPFTLVSSPKLTTVSVPKHHLGRMAAQKLLERIKTGADVPHTKTCINTTLVVRNSVKSIAE